MCLIINVPKETKTDITDEVMTSIDNGWKHNHDGAGLAYTDGTTVSIFKGFMKKKEFKKTVRDILKNRQSDVLIHLRNASAGKVSKENTHPFKVGNYAMVHNGTIGEFSKGKGALKSDTQLFGEFISGLTDNFIEYSGYDDLIEDFIGSSKVCFLGASGVTKIYNEYYGIQSDSGLWYSNNYYLGVEVKTTKKATPGYCKTCGIPLVPSEDEECAYCTGEYQYGGYDIWSK